MKKNLMLLSLLLSLTILTQGQLSFFPVGYGNSDQDESYDICTDNTGNVYFTGRFMGPSVTFGPVVLTNPFPGSFSAYVVGVDVTGTPFFGVSGSGNGDARGVGICPDNLGNIYIVGDFTGTSVTFGTAAPIINSDPTGYYRDVFVIKIDAGSGAGGGVGNLVWSTSGAGDLDEFGHSIAFASGGGVGVTGSFNSPVVTFPGTTPLTNTSTSPPFTHDVYIGWIDIASGAFTQSVSLAGTDDDFGNDIAMIPGGGVFVTGNFNSPVLSFGSFTGVNSAPPNADIFFVEVTAAGSCNRMETVTGTEHDYAYSIGLDSYLNCWITGCFFSPELSFAGTPLVHSSTNPFPDEDYYLVKYLAGGGVDWVRGADADLDPQWNFDDLGRSVSVDKAGNAYVIGWYKSNKISFVPGSVRVNSTNNNYAEIFMAKYTPSGAIAWITDAKGMIDDYGQGVALDSLTGCIHYTGFYESELLAFGTSSIDNGGSPTRDLFVTAGCPDSNCVQACPNYQDSLHTGIAGPGSLDGSWSLVVDPAGGTVPRPANIIPPAPGWNPPFPSTNYISSTPTGVVPVVGTFVFERQFYVDPSLVNPRLTFCVLVDDIADAFVDGIPVGSAGSYLFPSSFTTNILSSGMHTLRVDVTNNPAIYMGLDIRGWLCFDHFVGTDPRQKFRSADILTWPNPARESLHVITKTVLKEWKISSITGQQLLQSTVSGKEVTIPVQDLREGIYLLHVRTVGGATTVKIVVAR